MSSKDYIKIDLSHFPDDERFAQIPGKLFVVDNIDHNLDESYRQEHPNFPVQVAMAVSFLVVQGYMEISIGLQHYTLGGNQSVLVVPGTFFQVHSASDDLRCIFLAISPDFMNYTSDVKLGVELGRRLNEHPIITLTDEEVRDNIELYQLSKKKLTDSSYQFKEEVARSFLNILKCDVFQKFMEHNDVEKSDKPSNRKEEIFFNFLSFARKHFRQQRGIAFYADKMCMSPKYLSSVVHEVSDKYATDWINEYVILEAKAMLRSPGVTVKEVAIKLHFANQSFFAKFFKQHTGHTPREYMNM